MSALRFALAPLVSVLLGATLDLSALAQPRVEVDRHEVDLGVLVKGEVAEARFEMRNVGDAPLHILSVKPACGCTVVDYDEEIAPGATGAIAAKLDSASLHGAVDRGITVATDDPESPAIAFTLRAVVVSSVTFEPFERVQLSNRTAALRRGAVVVRRESTESGTLAITDVRASAAWLRVDARAASAEEAARDGLPATRPGDWIVEVELAGPVPYGRSSETVQFRTGLPRQPEVSLPVFVDAQPPVRLSVSPLELPASADADATVVVTVRRGLDAAGLDVAADTDALALELERSGPQAYKLHVRRTRASSGGAQIAFRVGGETYSLPVVAAR